MRALCAHAGARHDARVPYARYARDDRGRAHRCDHDWRALRVRDGRNARREPINITIINI